MLCTLAGCSVVPRSLVISPFPASLFPPWAGIVTTINCPHHQVRTDLSCEVWRKNHQEGSNSSLAPCWWLSCGLAVSRGRAGWGALGLLPPATRTVPAPVPSRDNPAARRVTEPVPIKRLINPINRSLSASLADVCGSSPSRRLLSAVPWAAAHPHAGSCSFLQVRTRLQPASCPAPHKPLVASGRQGLRAHRVPKVLPEVLLSSRSAFGPPVPSSATPGARDPSHSRRLR